jgi:hypothetical protein
MMKVEVLHVRVDPVHKERLRSICEQNEIEGMSEGVRWLIDQAYEKQVQDQEEKSDNGRPA